MGQGGGSTLNFACYIGYDFFFFVLEFEILLFFCEVGEKWLFWGAIAGIFCGHFKTHYFWRSVKSLEGIVRIEVRNFC